MCQIFRNNKPLPEYFTNRKLKMCSFINKRRQKRQNFQFFKGKFLRNARPYGYDFWRVFEDLCETSNKYNFPIFFKI